MGRLGNMTLTKVNNSSETESKNNEVVEMLRKAFKSCLLLKVTSDLKGESNKQTNGGRKSIQDQSRSLITRRNNLINKYILGWGKYRNFRNEEHHKSKF